MCPTVVLRPDQDRLLPGVAQDPRPRRRHLRRAGVEAAIWPCRRPCGPHALERNDRALNHESGFPELVTFLRDELVGQGAAGHARPPRQRRAGGGRPARVASSRAERRRSTTPSSARLVRQLEEAKAQAERLRSGGPWQQTLTDGMVDLVADVDHDLRARLRQLTARPTRPSRAATRPRRGTSSSPGSTAAVAEDVVTNYTFLQQRAGELAAASPTTSSEDGSEIVGQPRHRQARPGAHRRPSVRPDVELDRKRPVGPGLAALRGDLRRHADVRHAGPHGRPGPRRPGPGDRRACSWAARR